MSKIKLSQFIKEFVDNTGQEEAKLSNEDKKILLDKIREYNRIGEQLYGETDMMDIAKNLTEIAEGAHQLTFSAVGESFDKVTLGRNMKDLKSLSEQFSKTAAEVKQLKERVVSLYEEMGNILNRYYDISD